MVCDQVSFHEQVRIIKAYVKTQVRIGCETVTLCNPTH